MTAFPQALLDGYNNFKTGRLVDDRDRYARLADEGQAPETAVIACCDSRAAPSTIFNTAAGDIFVVRNVANLVPPYAPDGSFTSVSAAIEFAVQGLQVKNILVLGHSRCGGVNAALGPAGEPLSEGDFIGTWVTQLASAAEAVRSDPTVPEGERQTTLERRSIRDSVANLRTFPFIAARESEGTLALHGAWFDIANGELWTMDPATGDFASLN